MFKKERIYLRGGIQHADFGAPLFPPQQPTLVLATVLTYCLIASELDEQSKVLVKSRPFNGQAPPPGAPVAADIITM